MEAYELVVSKAVEDGVIPGAIFLANDIAGKLRYSKAVSGLDSTYTDETVLEVASLTKLITTIAALQLVERGLIRLEDDVSHLIPEFSKRGVLDSDVNDDGSYASHPRHNAITLHRLLTHSAGGAYTFTDDRIAKLVDVSPGYMSNGTINSNFDFPLSYEPGEGWRYSNSLDKVGQIIEKLTKLTLENYFKQYIFHPLGISSASFWGGKPPPMAVREHGNTRTVPDPEATSFTTGLKECFGGQGLFINLPDYMKILRSLLLDDEALLKRKTTALMFKPSLSPASKVALIQELESATWTVGDIPKTKEYDWGLGGLLIDGDSHPYRRRNTLLWSGAPSVFWFIDRNAGVCGVFGTQVLPPSDPIVLPVIKAFEEAVYIEKGLL
ncbi:unnamed protein product [Clonostachys byssicola]|uniref:Beta-lactamase-related domain-containing protein n=1 Tax=Clonostachys byssicola TaxID=160290 RepID=A0A9N9U557_9HYPO|nr:unnamed protein product [Clonostachys byssicola]